MEIRQLSKKLRFVADAIDSLFEIRGTPAIAKRILSYKGKHWTQTPEGKKKLRKALAKGVKTRHANKNS